MPELERKVWDLAEAKATDSGHGSFSGYASLFGVKDARGDVVTQGAFADTLPQFIDRGFIAWGHDWNQPVATIAQAREDARGLFIKADFHSDAQSQRARTITTERLAREKFVGLSIGYLAEDADYQPDARVLKKIHLFETSLVTVPMLAPAGVTAAKSADTPHGPDLAATPDTPTAPSAADLLAALEALVGAPDAIERPQLAGLLKRARDLVRALEKAAAPPPDDLAALAARFRELEVLHSPSAPRGPVRLHGGR